MVWPSLVSLNTTLVPVVTALLNVAPLLLTNVKLRKACVLPTEPLTKTVPLVPALIVTDWALLPLPLSVLPNVMLAPAANPPWLVVSNRVSTVTSTSSAISIELGPLVRTVPPLKVLLPAASVSKCNGALTQPMAPVYVV